MAATEEDPAGGGDSGSSGDGRVSEADVSCHCCYELLLEPTSLDCGHTVCRHCLAQWFSVKRQQQCPTCRCPWRGAPKVNITLRDIMRSLYPERVAVREREIAEDPEHSRRITQFDQTLQRLQTGANAAGSDVDYQFWMGVVTTVAVYLVVQVATLVVPGGGEEDKARGGLGTWSPAQVGSWLETQGPWARHFADLVRLKSVDGARLVQLSGNLTQLMTELPAWSAGEASRLAALVSQAQAQTLPAFYLWTDIMSCPGWGLVLAVGLLNWPRVTLLALYWTDFSSSFAPLLRLSQSTWVGTWLRVMLVPHYSLAQAVWAAWSRDFWWSALYVAGLLLLAACCEIHDLLATAMGRRPLGVVGHVTGSCFSLSLLYVTSCVLPDMMSSGLIYYYLLFHFPYNRGGRLLRRAPRV